MMILDDNDLYAIRWLMTSGKQQQIQIKFLKIGTGPSQGHTLKWMVTIPAMILEPLSDSINLLMNQCFYQLHVIGRQNASEHHDKARASHKNGIHYTPAV